MTIEGGSTSFPTEFEIPRRRITPAEITSRLDTYFPEIELRIAKPGKKVSLGLKVDEKNRMGEAFVLWGEALNGLNGTYMEPADFFDYFSPQLRVTGYTEARKLLLGDLSPAPHPLLSLASPEGRVEVNIFGGATNRQAIAISEIGDKGEFSPEDLATYQKSLYEVFRPIAERPSEKTRVALGLASDQSLTIDEEDCAATGDTVGGVGLVLQKEGFLPEARRIDVAVATAQALVVLAHLTQKQGIPMEVNVGYASFGLSLGVNENLEHKNYITIAPIPELIDAYPGRIFVVGDMGVAAKRVLSLPWDRWRSDRWGLEDPKSDREVSYVDHILADDKLNDEMDLRIGYEKGGLLMMAMVKQALFEAKDPTEFPLVMAVAKRLDLGDRGFGLRLDNLLEYISSYV